MVLKNFKIYFFNWYFVMVVVDAGIFPFTQAQVYVQVFDLAAFVYIYFTFTSLEVVVELCTLLRYEVIALK